MLKVPSLVWRTLAFSRCLQDIETPIKATLLFKYKKKYNCHSVNSVSCISQLQPLSCKLE